jgi:hypothetical protein
MLKGVSEDMYGTRGELIRRRILFYGVLACCLWQAYVIYHQNQTIERQHRVILMLWEDQQTPKPKMRFR